MSSAHSTALQWVHWWLLPCAGRSWGCPAVAAVLLLPIPCAWAQGMALFVLYFESVTSPQAGAVLKGALYCLHLLHPHSLLTVWLRAVTGGGGEAAAVAM